MLVAEIISYVLRFGRLIVLTRILRPADFGVFALAAALVAGLVTLTAIGPRTYLVQASEVSVSRIRTVWTADALRSIALCLIGIFLGPHLLNATSSEGVWTIRIASLAALFIGVRSPGIALAERALSYRRIALLNVVSAAIGFVTTLSLGIAFRSPVALAVGLVATELTEAVGSWLVFPRMWPIGWSRTEARAFLRIGSSLLVVSMGSYVMTQGDYLVIGRVLDATSVGIYLLAFRIGEIPAIVLSNVGNRIGTSFLSRSTDQTELRGRYAAFAQAGLSIAIGASLAMITLAEPLVNVLLGDAYVQATGVLQIISVAILGRSVSHLISPLMVATGQFKKAAHYKVIEVAVFAIALLIGVNVGGLLGASTGVATGYLMAAALRVGNVNRTLGWTTATWWSVTAKAGGLYLVASAISVGVQAAGLADALALTVGGLSFAFALVYQHVLSRDGLGRRLMRELRSSGTP